MPAYSTALPTDTACNVDHNSQVNRNKPGAEEQEAQGGLMWELIKGSFTWGAIGENFQKDVIRLTNWTSCP